ncbi:hypothetical protein BDF19DRAFT_422740 [Syncephalis fuscata]|nr:hypothetical protein BDF19DRAFT_422740 [Syncephalis fuscata]
MESRTVVVALNDSPVTLYALNWALSHVFRVSDDTLQLLHVVKLPEEQSENSDYCIIATPRPPAASKRTSLQRSTVQGYEIIQRGESVVKAAFPDTTINYKTEIVYNNSIVNGILDFVHNPQQTSILVLGKKELPHDTQSSFTQQQNTIKFCVHNAHCPVVVVREQKK